MFGWVLGLAVAAADPSCDADASSGAALVLPSEVAHVVIRVDDLEDRLAADAADRRVPLSRAAQCVPSSSEHPKGTGSCTLRAALELSATAAEKTAVTLALRSGRFLLAAPLPEVVGTVQLVGTAASEGGSLPALPHGGGGDDGASAPPDEDAPPGSGEGAGDGGDTGADGPLHGVQMQPEVLVSESAHFKKSKSALVGKPRPHWQAPMRARTRT